MPTELPSAPPAMRRAVDLINIGIYFSHEAHASLAESAPRAAHLLRHAASRIIEAAEQLEGAPCSH